MSWKPPHHEFHRISNNVYYLSHGDHDRPAIGVIIGKEATMLVDAGNSNHHAGVVLKFLQELSHTREVAPVRYVVLTHWHWDHSFGAVGYEEAQHTHQLVGYPVIIGHQLTTEELKRQQSYAFNPQELQKRVDDGLEIEFIQKYMMMEYADLSIIDIRTPKLSYQTAMDIDLGGIEVSIEHIACDHAADSSLIFVSDSSQEGEKKFASKDILFLGDVLYPNLYTNRTYTVEKMNILLSKLSEYTCDLYIDAHDIPWNSTDFATLLHDYRLICDYFKRETGLTNRKSKEIVNMLEFQPRDGRSQRLHNEWTEIQISVVEAFLNQYNH